MCPLRFILVFFSAVLAGYFAWRTVRSSPDYPSSDDESTSSSASAKGTIGYRKVAENGFWGFVDMASGKYLWRNIKELRGGDRSCYGSETS